MKSDLFDDPNLQSYLTRAEREMLPMMEKSAIAITLVTGSVDVKICLEIGAAIMLDKPIIAVISEGAKVPANLKRVANVIVEGNMKDAATLAKLQQAISNIMAQDPRAPKYWQHETTGVLYPVVMAYLTGKDMNAEQVATMRAYLRQWIQSPVWYGGEELRKLRASIDVIQTRDDIEAWLCAALDEGFDPL